MDPVVRFRLVLRTRVDAVPVHTVFAPLLANGAVCAYAQAGTLQQDGR